MPFFEKRRRSKCLGGWVEHIVWRNNCWVQCFEVDPQAIHVTICFLVLWPKLFKIASHSGTPDVEHLIRQGLKAANLHYFLQAQGNFAELCFFAAFNF